MKIRNIYIMLASFILLMLVIACSDSEIDSQFKASMNDREATFTLSIDKSSIEAGPAASSHSFSILSTDSWQVTSSVPWISFSSTSSSGNGTISITIQENTSIDPRSATISVIGIQSKIEQLISVHQNGFVFDIECQSIEFDANGGNKEVGINTNGSFEIINDYDWISCVQNNSKILITANPNSGLDSRSAEIIIKLKNSDHNKTIVVSQSGINDLNIIDFDKDKEW